VEQADTRLGASPLDGLTSPAFLCRRDAGIVEANGPAGALLADWASAPFDRPAGDLLGCLNAVAAGCGHGANCGECPVREAIRRATDGLRVERQPVAMHLVRGGSVQRVELRLTAAPVSRGGERLALVVLEPSEWVR